MPLITPKSNPHQGRAYLAQTYMQEDSFPKYVCNKDLIPYKRNAAN